MLFVKEISQLNLQKNYDCLYPREKYFLEWRAVKLYLIKQATFKNNSFGLQFSNHLHFKTIATLRVPRWLYFYYV